jgi:serine/threonine protein phosphatase 1
VPLEGQNEETCLWIRERFLRAGPGDLPAHVVHGHTPHWADKPDARLPELLPHRTNLDTGAFMTGVLTAGVFDPATPGGPIRLLTTKEL